MENEQQQQQGGSSAKVVSIERTTTKIVEIETTTKQSKSRQLCPLGSLANVESGAPKKKEEAPPKSGQGSADEARPVGRQVEGENEPRQRDKAADLKSKSCVQRRRASAETAVQEARQQSANQNGPNEQKQLFSLKQLARQSRNFANPKAKRANSIQANESERTTSRTNTLSNSQSFSDTGGSGSSATENDQPSSNRQPANRQLLADHSASNQGKQSIPFKASGPTLARSKSNKQQQASRAEVTRRNSSSSESGHFLPSNLSPNSDQDESDGSGSLSSEQSCSRSSELLSDSSSYSGNSSEERATEEGEQQGAKGRPRDQQEVAMKSLSRKLKTKRRGGRSGRRCEHESCGPLGAVSWQDEPLRLVGGGEQQTAPTAASCSGSQEAAVSRVRTKLQQVTDVDLITYKHLCHLETSSCPQCCQQVIQTNLKALDGPTVQCRCCLTAQSQQQQQQSSSGATNWPSGRRRKISDSQSGANNSSHTTATTKCPYYDLCLGLEEKLIRQKFAWFPPSLKTLQLVEQFFSYFPPDKIPYQSSGSSHKQHQQQQHQAAPNQYRTQQVEFQLPKQDISLDYCSYKLNEQGRTSYEQFVDKRNSQALDVGYVIEFAGVQQPPISVAPNQQQEQQAAQLEGRTVSGGSQLAAQQRRKSSLAGGESTLVGSVVGPGGQPLAVQRCRRCLVRFETGQLVVVAPNFVLASATKLSATSQQQQQTNAALAASLFQVASQLAATSAAEQPLGGAHSPIVDTQLHRRASTVSMTIQPDSRPLAGPERAAKQWQRQQWHAPPSLAHQNCALFHPQCFTCSTCKEFLVDLVYCLRENKLYCLRHYGESVRPRCSWCQELIFSDEYLKAMNENFHVDHFVCRHCDSNLAGQRYVLREEKPYCIQCYEENFANQCEDCQKPIGIDSRDLSYKERHWHDTCFVCAQCSQSLIDKPFGSKNDKVYCAECYENSFATRCDGCKNPFRAGSKKMEYHGRQWHDSCFCCCVCKNTIGSNSFIPKNDEIYCIKCYEDKYATRCTKCKQVIVSGGVTFKNEPWHRDCFNCCNCNKSLAGQRFTTRDNTSDDSGKNLNKTNQPHNAYCIDCYGELFAKKCFACSQAITGMGGTRFVTFEERSWHNDCFLCNDCQTSLVGKGFITDGPESILCSECARAKLR